LADLFKVNNDRIFVKFHYYTSTGLKIYKKDKKNYIVISNLKELTQAERIAKKLHADIVSHLN